MKGYQFLPRKDLAGVVQTWFDARLERDLINSQDINLYATFSALT